MAIPTARDGIHTSVGQRLRVGLVVPIESHDARQVVTSTQFALVWRVRPSRVRLADVVDDDLPDMRVVYEGNPLVDERHRLPEDELVQVGPRRWTRDRGRGRAAPRVAGGRNDEGSVVCRHECRRRRRR